MDPVWIVGLALGAYALYHEHQRKKRARHNTTEEVCGYFVIHEHIPDGARSTPPGVGAVEHWKNVTTIQGALPPWAAFGWTVDTRGAGAPRDHNTLWAEIILGPAPMLATGGTVYAAHGDLVFETPPGVDPRPSRDLIDAARPFLQKKPYLIDELARYVEANLVPANAIAFRILARSCPDKRHAHALADRHRASADPGLAAAIAELEYPAGKERLVEIVNGSAPADAKKIALRTLVSKRDADGLAAVIPASVPSELAAEFIEALGRTRRHEAEAAALFFLRHETAAKTALDVLAAVGGRDAITPLLELKASGVDSEEAAGLDITIELVRGRIAQDGGARGTLSIAEGEGQGGAVSFTKDGGMVSLADAGELALTDDD